MTGPKVEESRRALESERRQHASEDFQPQIWLVAQAIGTALDHPDFVVKSFHEAERDLVLRATVGRDAVPVAVDHLGEFLVRFEPLPLEPRLPVLEETPRPAFAFIAPQLSKTLLENISRVESLVGRKQCP